MTSLLKKKTFICNISILSLIFIVFCFMSCKKKDANAINFKYDPNVVPMLNTDSVTMLISDSGIIKYKMIAKTWKIYDSPSNPYWFFPKGFYIEQFDSTFQIVATVKSDTAWNYSRKKLWKLRGNVIIHNRENEVFTSDELFWDQNKQKIYSNTFVEINRPGKTLLKAYNFESNQQMSEYSFSNVYKSKIYVNDTVNQSHRNTTQNNNHHFIKKESAK